MDRQGMSSTAFAPSMLVRQRPADYRAWNKMAFKGRTQPLTATREQVHGDVKLAAGDAGRVCT